MTANCFIFDMDDVLSGYDLDRRLAVMQEITGIAAPQIRARLWDSGFEDEADAGLYPDGDSYLKAFSERLGFEMTRDQWLHARMTSMSPFMDMLALAEHLKQSATIAIFSNNVPLLEEMMDEAFPQALNVFGEHIYFSCSLKLAKPDPVAYREVARLLSVDCQSCIFTDDKAENALGACEAGMTGIHFQSPGQFKAALADAGVDLSAL